MEYKSTIFQDRISEHPNRRRLVPVEGAQAGVYDVYREDGTITQDGTPWNALTMNTLDKNIANIFSKGTFTPEFYTTYAGNIYHPMGGNAQYTKQKGYYSVVNNICFLHIEIEATLTGGNFQSNVKIGAIPEIVKPSFNGYGLVSSSCNYCRFRDSNTNIGNNLSLILRSTDDEPRRYFYLLKNNGNDGVPIDDCANRDGHNVGSIDFCADITYQYL